MTVLEKWMGVALSIGHHPLNAAGDVAIMSTRHEPRPVNNGAWGIGLLVLAIMGLITLGLAWLLIFPYLFVWAIVAARRSLHPRNQVQRYMLSVDAQGWLVTDPDYIAADLIDAAIKQGRISEDQLQ